MAVFILNENYRASQEVLKKINKIKIEINKNSGSLIFCNKGKVEGLFYEITDINKVAGEIESELDKGHTVALLCRNNEEVSQWQIFLENYVDSGKQPLKGRTRLIQDGPLKVHRLWPIWWFFHGYTHLHPVPERMFKEWCKKLGLAENDCIKEECDYPNNSGTTSKVLKIKEAPPSCSKKQQINGRIADLTPISLTDAWDLLENEKAHDTACRETINRWFDQASRKDFIKDYKSEWEQMLSDFKQENNYFGMKITWLQLWNLFEEYYDELENHLPKDKVILSTIHKSKGCEFDSVFLCDWENSNTELKIFYVGCSRPRKNLYVLPPNLICKQNKNETNFKFLATPDMVKNQFALDEAFKYKDASNNDFSLIYNSNNKDIWLVDNWESIKKGEISNSSSSISNSDPDLNFSLRSNLRIQYETEVKTFYVYFQGSEYGAIPLILPIIQKSLKKKNKNLPNNLKLARWLL